MYSIFELNSWYTRKIIKILLVCVMLMYHNVSKVKFNHQHWCDVGDVEQTSIKLGIEKVKKKGELIAVFQRYCQRSTCLYSANEKESQFRELQLCCALKGGY